jgi:hypothetical protein
VGKKNGQNDEIVVVKGTVTTKRDDGKVVCHAIGGGVIWNDDR